MVELQLSQTFFRLLFLGSLLTLFLLPARAQQPFVTDDADVTPKGKFHFEFSNEFDLLQRSSFPNLKQNTADFELAFGLFEHVEIAIEAPLITLFNTTGTTPKTVTGIGDSNLSVKYNFRRERDGSAVPAFSVGVNLELPTGDTTNQLGSGLSDIYLNGIAQKSLTKNTTLRLNTGMLFSGNTTTGAIGIRTRGTVITAGGSLVKTINPKLQLGMELTGAHAQNLQLGKGQLQTMFGGNYQLQQKMTLDFGLIAGRGASPRAGVQIGIAVDF